VFGFGCVSGSGGRASVPRYAGSFATQREALIRKGWVAGELAAMRVPDLELLAEPVAAPTLRDVATRWKASRVDVAEATRVLHRVALDRVLPILGTRAVDKITSADVAAMVARLTEDGYARETISKSVNALAQTLDHAGIDPNPARDKRQVRLPREEREELQPPTAEHVEAVYRLIPRKHRLALLWLDWSGARVGSVDLLRVSDYDEPERRVRLRASTTKTRRALWVDLPDVLADALEEALGPREDRDPTARLFSGSGADALRTSIAKACAALAIPLFSPHDLRHRRISLLHRQGRSWADIGAFVGQRSARVTSDVYTHVLLDDREVDYANLLARARTVQSPVQTPELVKA
jgi:integrase